MDDSETDESSEQASLPEVAAPESGLGITRKSPLLNGNPLEKALADRKNKLE